MLVRTRSRRAIAGLIAVLTAIVMVAAGCGGREAQTGQQSKNINIGYIAWDEDIAVSYLYKELLERKGYHVELQQLEAGPIYAGLSKGKPDLFMDSWLPSTHADYWKQYGSQLEDLGIWYNQATLNLAVPNYVGDVNSIADLKGKAAMFGGGITGIEPSAGESRIVQNQAMPKYGLTPEWQLKLSSTTAMLASLEKAIKDKQPIVVSLWHPHWAYAKYPLKDLKDPQGGMGAAEELHSIGRKGFSKDFPEVTAMVKKFKLNDQQLGQLENEVNSAPKGQEQAAAKKWAEANPQVVASFNG